MKNQRGQAVTEAILIMIVLFGFASAVSTYFKSNEILKKLVTGPFVYLAGMMQNGVWQPADAGASIHPAAHGRHIVITGDPVQ